MRFEALAKNPLVSFQVLQASRYVWNASITANAATTADCAAAAGAAVERLWEELVPHHPDHRSCGEAEPRREDRVNCSTKR